MICTCMYCERCFWRYRRDYPPHGYCSVPCHDDHRDGVKRPGSVPASPASVLQMMYRHRRETHNTTSILAWFNCGTCDMLENMYRRSLAYHQELSERALVDAIIESRYPAGCSA